MHDAETGRHIDRDHVLLVRVAAPMHDVGKVAIPDGILRKRGPLTAEEREEMQRHTTVGYQITAVADVFDALLSDRCYRPALPLEEAVEVMRRGRGTQFDPRIGDALLDHLEDALSLRG